MSRLTPDRFDFPPPSRPASPRSSSPDRTRASGRPAAPRPSRLRAALLLLALLLAALPALTRAQITAPSAEGLGLGQATYAPVEGTAELARFNRMFRQVANRVRPSVVFIGVQTPTSGELPESGEHQLDEDFLRRYFEPELRESAGSGVLVSPRGYIVTNHHVVSEAVNIRVMLRDKREFDAEVVGSDPTTDVAVLKIDGASNLPVIGFGDSDDVQVGDWVIAVGNPFHLNSTVTAGIVSAMGRQVGIIRNELGIEDFIQTDAAINPGNSGGALVDVRGQLVGINTAIATRDGASEGYGFAIPVNLVERVVRDLIAYGEVRRGYLGVQIDAVSSDLAEERDMSEIRGVLVADVADGGAADRAGLEPQDIILTIDGEPVNATNELQRRIAYHRPGDRVSVEVLRDGRIQSYQVRLFGRQSDAFRQWMAADAPAGGGGSAPGSQSQEPFSLVVLDEWGLGLRGVTQSQQERFGRRDGAYVAFVEGDSPASSGGLPRDVVITHVEERQVRDAADVRSRLQELAGQQETVLVRVVRDGGTPAYYEVESPAPESPDDE